jgi:hypothetical protein
LNAFLNALFSFTQFLVQVSTALFNSPFSGPSLQYTGGTDPNNKNYVKLKDALNSADIERRKQQEEAAERERAAELKREERLAKIKYMQDMPDTKAAGTG